MQMHIQYEYVKSSRQALLLYCGGISATHFVTENSFFGKGSIRNLLVHIGNTYEYWIGKQALNLAINFTEYDSIKNASEAAAYFLRIDLLLNRFMAAYADNYLTDLEITTENGNVTASPFKLFSHVVTHEYHHKGQILSLSRHLGYIPIDTDIIR